VSITLTASEYALHYAFDAGAQDPFVILEYTTPAEKGWMMLYSADGHFEGDVSLAYSGAGGKTSVALTSRARRAASAKHRRRFRRLWIIRSRPGRATRK